MASPALAGMTIGKGKARFFRGCSFPFSLAISTPSVSVPELCRQSVDAVPRHPGPEGGEEPLKAWRSRALQLKTQVHLCDAE